jgi:hypothetical protein
MSIAAAAAAVMALGLTPAHADNEVSFHTANTQTVLSVPAELQGAQPLIATFVSGVARTTDEGAAVAGVEITLTDAAGNATTGEAALACESAGDCEWTFDIPFPLLPGVYTAKATMTNSNEETASDSISITIL